MFQCLRLRVRLNNEEKESHQIELWWSVPSQPTLEENSAIIFIVLHSSILITNPKQRATTDWEKRRGGHQQWLDGFLFVGFCLFYFYLYFDVGRFSFYMYLYISIELCFLLHCILYLYLYPCSSKFSSFIFVFFKVGVVSKSGSSKEQGEQTMVWKEVVVRKEKSFLIFLKWSQFFLHLIFFSPFLLSEEERGKRYGCSDWFIQVWGGQLWC